MTHGRQSAVHLAASDWQPVRYAPRDGTELRLLCQGRTRFGHWDGDCWASSIDETLSLSPTHFKLMPKIPDGDPSGIPTDNPIHTVGDDLATLGPSHGVVTAGSIPVPPPQDAIGNEVSYRRKGTRR